MINDIINIVKEEPRKVIVNVMVEAKIGKPLKITIDDGANKVIVTSNIVDKSRNKPITKEDIIDKITRVGDTVYSIDNIDIVMDKDIFIPFKTINDLRRDAFTKLDNTRLYRIKYEKCEYSIEVNDFKKEKLKSVLVSKVNSSLDYDIIYSMNNTDNAIIKLPKVMDNYDIDNSREYLVGELGAFNKIENIYTDYSFNVVNSYTVALLHSLGAKRITLSLELTKTQIDNLIKGYIKRYNKMANLEVIVSGYREVMTLKTNLNKIYKNDNIYLVDRFNNKYKVREINNLTYIYEPKIFKDNNDYYEIGVNVLRDNKEV